MNMRLVPGSLTVTTRKIQSRHEEGKAMTVLPQFFNKTSRNADQDNLAGRIQWLNQVRLFEDLKGIPGAIEHLARLMDNKHYSKHTSILSEGEDGSDAFFLTAGTIKVQKSIAGGESFPV